MKFERMLAVATLALIAACGAQDSGGGSSVPPAGATGGQASVQDDESAKDIVKVAVGSKDHTTLVAAVQAADLVNALANAGPFTVFAPTNAAFDKLPKGTVETLLKKENIGQLKSILYHHVTTSAWELDNLTDGLVLDMADNKKTTITRKGEDVFIDGAKILGSVRASNGMVFVVDGVIVPK